MSTLLFTLSVLFSAMVASVTVYAQSSSPMEPILKIEPTSKLPFMELVLRDPAMKIPSTSIQAKAFLTKAKALEDKLKNPAAAKDAKILGELLNAYVGIIYFAEDVDRGISEGESLGDLKPFRLKVKKYGKAFAEVTKDENQKKLALYHALTAAYLTGTPEEALQEFATFVSTLNDTKPLSANFELFAALAELDQTNQEFGRKRLEKLLPKLTDHRLIIAHLLLARSYGGVDSNGQVFQEHDPKYKVYLSEASRRSSFLSSEQKEKALQYMLGIWTAAEGDSIDWEKSPIQWQAFKDQPQYQSIEEHMALQAHAKGDTASALQTYAKIVSTFKGKPTLVPLYDRILELTHIQSEKTKNPKIYTDTLRSINAIVRKPNFLDEKSKKTAANAAKKFKERYRVAVMESINLALSPQADPVLRVQAIQIINDYLAFSPSPKERAAFKEKIAQLYIANNDHTNAVLTYQDLKKQSKGEETTKYLRLIIESQVIIAKWPTIPPWSNVPPGDQPPRSALASSLDELAKSTSYADWDVLAHLGLLKISLNDQNAAFDAWLKGMQKNPNSEHAEKAAGLILTTQASSKQWVELLSAIKVIRKAKISPVMNSKRIDTEPYLADALFFGGLGYLEKNDAKSGSLLLEEFTKKFAKDPRYVDAVFKKGVAFFSINQNPKAILAMREIVTEYSSSKYLNEAILTGIKKSTVGKDQIFFYEAYLKTYPNNADFQEMQDKLALIYLKNEIYGPASLIYEQKSKNNKLPIRVRMESALKRVNIEEKFGDPKKARDAAEYALTIEGGDHGFAAQAIAFLARYAHSQKNVTAYEDYEKLLTKLDATNFDVMETHGLIKLLIAERNTTKLIKEVDSRTLKNPVKEIQNQLAIYNTLRAGFEDVCAVGRTQFCEKAKISMSAMTMQSIRVIDSIVLPSNLDEKSIQTFEASKAKIKTILSQTLIRKDAKNASAH